MQILPCVTIIEKGSSLLGNCSVGESTTVHQQITIKFKPKSLFIKGKLRQKLGERYTSRKEKEEFCTSDPKVSLSGFKRRIETRKFH